MVQMGTTILKRKKGKRPMNVITTLTERRREKQWNFEKKMLRHISMKEMEKAIKEWMFPILPFQFQAYPFLIDQCLDMTIDAYLLGTEFGRFGYYGEPAQEVRKRCEEELTDLSHCLCATLTGWSKEERAPTEALLAASDMLIGTWWEKGFREASKAYKLRLH
ncbi:hypothetical protein CHH73_20185 [Shouchella clausii]|jgi:hypothetical protein|nr:hypothetical protein CHH73_20185 [Shouchella clausii]